jgi:hypothetical protein
MLDLGTSWKWVVSLTPRSLYPRENSPQYPLDRRLGGPQNRLSLELLESDPVCSTLQWNLLAACFRECIRCMSEVRLRLSHVRCDVQAVASTAQLLGAEQHVCGRQLQVTWHGKGDGLCTQVRRSEPWLAGTTSLYLAGQLLLSTAPLKLWPTSRRQTSHAVSTKIWMLLSS